MASTFLATSCITISTPSKFSHKPSQLFVHAKCIDNYKLNCKIKNSTANHDDEGRNFPGKVDRRNVLLGLGGFYGAANFIGIANVPFALGLPVPAPDLSTCSTASLADGSPIPFNCCPPLPKKDLTNIPTYQLPSVSKLKVRPAAHSVDQDYITKYSTAIQRMKSLDKDDPLNFMQQANIHCAYCNTGYKELGFPGVPLQVHFSWLFFPFHRWYLYFFERILGSLIGDDTFALPFWNYDTQVGMQMPSLYNVVNSPLYDSNRNQNHFPPNVIDLGFTTIDLDATDEQKINNNLTMMYRQMITNAPCPQLFFGNPIRGGEQPIRGMGTIENIPHNAVHRWVGNPNNKFRENMGTFYSAARDPIFYAHHANIDRMWTIWKTLGGKRHDFNDRDWLDSAFLFYDENRNLVKVTVQDCLNVEKLGYMYQDVPIPWRNFRPTPPKKKVKKNAKSVKPATKIFPSRLNKTLSFSIQRPKISRSNEDKEREEELLVFNNMKFDENEYIRFDVFINEDEDVKAKVLDRAEYVGSFANLPHMHNEAGDQNTAATIPATMSLAITEILEDCGLEDEEEIVVILVPHSGGKEITIGSVEINTVACAT
ncbi:PREDICTED: polyphenol oxidase E, chloroplastic-like [Nicotiana attenuata]|uniref:catechol oxidase n=1 Tax=Nicotiana attenuata TaxID=49451 RepID=A0A314KT37_NICAT|nr:PREDICTED: polyphenol oxidase E, chloroplastic-like [Nicotiana attenuata]OIT32492.1 polyphenol oxidase e, chloroplastic [Nicotiana attenuata]